MAKHTTKEVVNEILRLWEKGATDKIRELWKKLPVKKMKEVRDALAELPALRVEWSITTIPTGQVHARLRASARIVPSLDLQTFPDPCLWEGDDGRWSFAIDRICPNHQMARQWVERKFDEAVSFILRLAKLRQKDCEGASIIRGD